MRFKVIYGNGGTRGAGGVETRTGCRYPEAEKARLARICPAYFPLLKKKRGTPGKQAS